MRKTLVFTTVVMMALSSAAFAQSADSPQAAPGGSVTNPPGADENSGAPKTNAMKPATKMHEGRASSDDTMSTTPAPKGDNNGAKMNSGNGQ